MRSRRKRPVMGSEDGADDLEGLPVGRAVEVVLDREGGADRATVRKTLRRVAEEDVVSRAAAQSALADLSKVVATPETRVEVASNALASAREAAEPVADLDVVAARLEPYESRLATVEAAVEELGPELRELVKGRNGAAGLYELAVGIGRLTEEAERARRAADELYADLEAFERWLKSPDRRCENLEGDLGALADAVEELETTVEGLAAGETPDADGRTAEHAWVDASVRRRVLDLLLADARAELADLRIWAEREDLEGGSRASGIEDRLEGLADRIDAAGGRLADLADDVAPDSHELAAFEAALSELEPPVDWAEVESLVERHRPPLTRDE